MKKTKFITFKEGLERIEAACKKVNLRANEKVITSKDEVAEKLKDLLNIPNAHDGFQSWQLPISFSESQLFFSIGSANTKVAPHSHDEGAGLRVIIAGSITYQNKELKSGDWMYIPKGIEYSFEVGNSGVTMLKTYQCCCVPDPR